MSSVMELLRRDREARRGQLLSASVDLKSGEKLEFYYYRHRTVADQAQIEKYADSQTEALLEAFMVCALDDEGKRLFKAVERDELRGLMSHDVLVRAALQMGTAKPEDDDPKD